MPASVQEALEEDSLQRLSSRHCERSRQQLARTRMQRKAEAERDEARLVKQRGGGSEKKRKEKSQFFDIINLTYPILLNTKETIIIIGRRWFGLFGRLEAAANTWWRR